MTADEIGKLKAELNTLNSHILAERNDEVRHALRRGRLEAERTQVSVKLVDAAASPAQMQLEQPKPEQPKPVPAVPLPAWASQPKRKRKPDGIPPISQMIAEALRNSTAQGHAELTPAAMAAFIRQKWWPSVKSADINTVAWQLARAGRLAKTGSLYRLNGVAH